MFMKKIMTVAVITVAPPAKRVPAASQLSLTLASHRCLVTTVSALGQ
ncbi:hypothetical protein WMF39_18805 [Sorangium sp. So ce1504]